MTVSVRECYTSRCVHSPSIERQSTSPIAGSLFSAVKGSVLVGDNTAGYSKVGVAEATGIVGVVVDGDCSIRTAMEEGGITKIHHVDSEVTNILGVYAKYKTVVYGD